MRETMNKEATIRSIKRSDEEAVLAWRNHSDVRSFMYTSHVISPEEHARWLATALLDTGYHVRIVELDYEPIGVVTFKRIYDGNVADWGFYTVPGSAKGSGLKLGIVALRHAFSELSLRKVCGQTLGFNHKSQKFHLRLGFAQEGILREQFADGLKVADVISFGLLKSEFDRRAS